MPVMVSPKGQEREIPPAGVAAMQRLGWKPKQPSETMPGPAPEPDPAAVAQTFGPFPPEPEEPAPRRRGRPRKR